MEEVVHHRLKECAARWRRGLVLIGLIVAAGWLGATPVAARTINVSAGGDLQAALNQAVAGDEIVLDRGATFTGNFQLPARPAGNGNVKWITIRTGAPDEALPPQDRRV